MKDVSGFKVHNYLQNCYVQIDVLQNEKFLKTLLILEKDGEIDENDVNEYIKYGNTLRIYIVDKDGNKKHYEDYEIDTEEKVKIKSLNIFSDTSGKQISTALPTKPTPDYKETVFTAVEYLA